MSEPYAPGIASPPYNGAPTQGSAGGHLDSREDLGEDADSAETRLLWRTIGVVIAVCLVGLTAVAGLFSTREFAVPIVIGLTVISVGALVALSRWANNAIRAARRQVRAHARLVAELTTSAIAQQQPPRADHPAPAHEVRGEMVENVGAQMWVIDGNLSHHQGVFAKLARRLQGPINRCFRELDEIEADHEDPVLLRGLYRVDHLVVLARRLAENLAVLGGEAPQRRSAAPVDLHAVLRAAVSEVEQYKRVSLVPTYGWSIQGHRAAEIIHLFAELIENATQFSDPDTPKVTVAAHRVTAGLAVEISDCGLGMVPDDINRANAMLDGSAPEEAVRSLDRGLVGLVVVRELARRNDVRVLLQTNIYEGISAHVVIPPPILIELEPNSPSPGPRHLDASSSPSDTPAFLRSPDQGERGHRRSDPQRAVSVNQPPLVAPTLGPRLLSGNTAAPRPTVGSNESRSARSSYSDAHPRNHLGSAQQDSDYRPVSIQGDWPHGSTPQLPSRQPRPRPGPTDGSSTVADSGLAEAETPPALPKRIGSHMPEQLRQTPSDGPAMAAIPGHNTGLMAGALRGRQSWAAENANPASNRPVSSGRVSGNPVDGTHSGEIVPAEGVAPGNSHNDLHKHAGEHEPGHRAAGPNTGTTRGDTTSWPTT